MKTYNYSRKIKTNLKATDANLKLMNSIHGQMSDGIWENSPVTEKYWKCSNIEKSDDNEIIIAVYEESIIDKSCVVRGIYYREVTRNPYANMTDDKIKAYYARKLRSIIKTEEKDEDYNPDKYNWSKDNQQTSQYLGYSIHPVTIADAYIAYHILMNKKIK